jgi:hypothetical protein
MTTIAAKIPDYLAKLAEEAAKKENTSVDHIVALALSSQVAAWQLRDSVEARAARGKLEDLNEILDGVPDTPPVVGDER